MLEGGIEGRPDNVLFYATSNRRHLMPRDMIDNERSTAINPSEAVEEKISLSDRFGLWLGFHNCSQDDYLAMVRGYVAHFKLQIEDAELEREALEWSMTRGARSGRVAWQLRAGPRRPAGTAVGGVGRGPIRETPTVIVSRKNSWITGCGRDPNLRAERAAPHP